MASFEARSKFIKAMQAIYGQFDSLDTQAAEKWQPPETAEGHKGRYLWTDGFAVMNFITLFRETSDQRYLTFARRLINTVHDVLGRTRDGKARLSKATDEMPLLGGLRIGKHEESGSDGDGQYFHYLTVWMFALNRMAVASGERWYNDQAVSLARAVFPHFVSNSAAARPRMFWKMSMDLSRPLVMSEGNLDPIDGYVTYKLLQETAAEGGELKMLDHEIAAFGRIVETKWQGYRSDDPLDLGMTLWTAHWFVGKEEWADGLAARALQCLSKSYPLFFQPPRENAVLICHKTEILVKDEAYFDAPTRYRLAFREFGTCLGIRCAGGDAELRAVAQKICDTWEGSGYVPEPTVSIKGRMQSLLPITAVMYATALYPGGKDLLLRPILLNSESKILTHSNSLSARLFKDQISPQVGKEEGGTKLRAKIRAKKQTGGPWLC